MIDDSAGGVEAGGEGGAHGNPRQDADIFTPVHYVRMALLHVPRGDIEGILARARIAPAQLEHDSSNVSAEQFVAVLAGAARALDDEIMGYGPSRIPSGAWAIACRSLIDAETLGQALRRFCRFYEMIDCGLRFRLLEEGESASIAVAASPAHDDFRFEPFALELCTFILHRFMNWLIRESVPLDVLAFSCPAPAHAAIIQEYFITTLLQFDAPVCRISFNRRMLQRRLRQDSASLRNLLKAENLELFTARYGTLSWSARLKSIVGRDLAAVPSFEDIASRLAIHPQTLRRRLAEEGVTFRDLKVDVRREAAFLLLGTTDMSVERIAAGIGFSQASAFTRAFREWTGISPQTYRRNKTRIGVH